METTGTLRVNAGISRLDGTRLAVQGAGNPFGEATDLIANRGLQDGDRIRVTGTADFVGAVPVIFVTDVARAV